MGMIPGGTAPSPHQQTRFSPDGFWWWDGQEWKPAVSHDRLWRWNGATWVPATPIAIPRSGGGAGLAIGLILAFVGVLVVVSVLVIVILLTMGNQIANVFSNVTAALNGP